MTDLEKREVLIERLVDDYVDSLKADRDFPYEIARFGFVGFANMTYDELVKCASDAGLDVDEEE